MDERQLIEGCVRGESWARKTIYEFHAPAMMSLCQRYVSNRETARDLMHDGFVKLFTKIHCYSGAGAFNGWMRRIFVTTALEHIRQKDVLRYGTDVEEFEQEVEDNDISIFEHLSANDLLDCVARLPDRYRTVFNLYAIEGYNHAEIAEELKISEGTSRSNYSRARQMLQKMVTKQLRIEK
jgi:RNA polymerase sigma-70 factor (ECF subfamily)